MIYTDFKGIKLSRLGMGTMRLPVSTKYIGHIDEEKAQWIIDYAMQQGINYYDTAYIYHKGASETFISQALAHYPRDSYYLADKFFIGANPHYKYVFEKQCEKLQTDHIDFYLMHSVFDITRPAYTASGAVRYFSELRERGRISYLGFSAHMSPVGVRKFIKKADWDFIQLQLNYEDWLFGDAAELYAIADEANLPIMVMEPVKGGTLSTLTADAEALLKNHAPDRSISSWAFRYLMRKPRIAVILSGMSTADQIKDNVETFSHECALTDEEEQLLLSACRMNHHPDSVPCTSCRYCCDTCPAHIEIPVMMNLFNTLVGESIRKAHKEAAPLHDLPHAGNCIRCGACTKHCPQHIPIPDIMDKLRFLFT